MAGQSLLNCEHHASVLTVLLTLLLVCERRIHTSYDTPVQAAWQRAHCVFAVACVQKVHGKALSTIQHREVAE